MHLHIFLRISALFTRGYFNTNRAVTGFVSYEGRSPDTSREFAIVYFGPGLPSIVSGPGELSTRKSPSLRSARRIFVNERLLMFRNSTNGARGDSIVRTGTTDVGKHASRKIVSAANVQL